VNATQTIDPTAIDCLICGTENTPDAAVCGYCYAPMVLGHEARAQEHPPRITTIIGDSNVGKTVYVGMLLDMLSKRADQFDAVPKGPYSVNLPETVISCLMARQFPPKTAMEVDQWNWAYYQITQRQGKKTTHHDLVMPDMAGEALAAEVSSPQTFTIVRSLLKQSVGVLMLVDAAVASSGSPHPDFFALKLMTYLDGLLAPKARGKIRTPVAIVLCKADYCPDCFDDPQLFAKTNLSRLWNLCENRFANFEFFACSVVGSLGYATDAEENVISYPLHIAPRGILEPFEWLLSKT